MLGVACGPKGQAHDEPTSQGEGAEASGATEAGGSSSAGGTSTRGGQAHAGSAPAASGGKTNQVPGMRFGPILVPGCDAFEPAEISQVFYVDSQNGNDDADGDAPDQAFRSLEHLKSLKLFPGDIVRLARGSRWDTGLEV